MVIKYETWPTHRVQLHFVHFLLLQLDTGRSCFKQTGMSWLFFKISSSLEQSNLSGWMVESRTGRDGRKIHCSWFKMPMYFSNADDIISAIGGTCFSKKAGKKNDKKTKQNKMKHNLKEPLPMPWLMLSFFNSYYTVEKKKKNKTIFDIHKPQ